MGSIPFGGIAALADESGRIAQAPLNGMMEQARYKALNTEEQGQSLQNQLVQRQIADQNALTRAITQYDPTKMTVADIPRLVTQNGGSGQAALQAQSGFIAARQNLLKMSDEEFARQQQQNDLVQGIHDQVAQAPAEQKQQVYSQGLEQLQKAGIDTSQEPQQYPGDQVFAQHLIPIRLHSALIADAAKQREMEAQQAKAAADTAKARADNATAGLNEIKLNLAKNATPGSYDQQIDAIYPPNDISTAGDNRKLKTLLNAALSRGDLESANKYISSALDMQESLSKEIAAQTNPQVQRTKIATAMAEGRGRQEIEHEFAVGGDQAVQNVATNQIPAARADAKKAGDDYAQAQSVSQRLQEMMDAARKGNVVSYQLIPQEGALQVTTSQGVHRINLAEIQNYGGGSAWQRLEGHIGKQLTGQSIPASVLNDMQDMQRIQEEGARSKYENSLTNINSVYGSKFKPVEMPTKQEKAQAGGAAKTPPAGATHIGVGSVDKKRHYLDAQGHDLGLAE